MPLTRLVAALVMALGLSTLPAGAFAGSSEYGRAGRPDGVLRSGCRDYAFRYVAKPGNVQRGNNDWALELFLSDKRGKGIGSVTKDSEIDPKRGKGEFSICKAVTVPGRFKIRGKLSVYDGFDLVDTVWIKPGVFRLRRP
jgi:hypothetical protein